MKIWLRRLGMAAVGVVAFVGPFFATLSAMDYLALRTAVNGKQVFNLVMTSSGNNWSLGRSNTSISDIKAAGITMVLQSGEPSFSFRTDNVSARKGQSYAVVYDIAGGGGTLDLGIVDTDTVIKRETISRRSGVLRFTAEGPRFMVALYNTGPKPLTVTVGKLTVFEEQP